MKNIRSVISKDGTKIDYHVFGQGTGIVILSGGGRSSEHYIQLAEYLSDSFQVYVIDRRGRNGSGIQGDNYNLEKECEDVIAVLNQTNSKYLFGHSYGAMIALKTACNYQLEKVAVYEPPVTVVSATWLEKFKENLAKQDYLSAQVTLIKGLEVGGEVAALPDEQIRSFLENFVNEEGVKELSKLLPLLVKEVNEVVKLKGELEIYKKITAKVLLLSGGRSPEYLKQSIKKLETVLPDYQSKIFPELEHNAPDIHSPEIVADTLKQFFKS